MNSWSSGTTSYPTCLSSAQFISPLDFRNLAHASLAKRPQAKELSGKVKKEELRASHYDPNRNILFPCRRQFEQRNEGRE